MNRKLLILLVMSVLVGCARESGQDTRLADISSRQIRVVTTTGMIADAVKNVGGQRVEVTALMGPGVDPHLYKASEGDVARMAGADLIFYNGLHLEGRMTEVFEQMQRRVKTVAVTKSIPPDSLLSPPGFQGNYDPHIWFDVRLWMQAVRAIGDQLAVFDSSSADLYIENTVIFLEKLDQLNAHVLRQAGSVPVEKRVLVTAHDAFNYFGRAYGFEVKGLQGISTAAEAGTADVQNLTRFIVERKIPAIFVESSVPPRYIEALQAAVKSRGADVQIGGNLFSDAMGSAGTIEGTYLGMVRHNIDTIVQALNRQ